jgi:hypothetical protein
MIPLIDLDTPRLVTKGEADAYAEFVRRYDDAWGEAIDPIAVRVKFDDAGAVAVHLRVLPLINDSDYRELLGFVGDRRLEIPGLDLGFHAVLAIAKDSRLRRQLSDLPRMFLGDGERLGFDWLGDYVLVGVEDRNELANAAFQELAPGPKSGPPEDDLAELSKLPAYAAIGLASRGGVDVALTAALVAAKRFDDVKSLERREYRDIRIDGVEFPRSKLRVYFAIGKKTLFIALSPGTVERLIDREADGRLPTLAKKGDAQFNLESTLKNRGALATVLSWLAEEEVAFSASAREASEVFALALGVPSGPRSALSDERFLRWFGERPVTPDGLAFQTTELGVLDPARGNDVWRRWPALPVSGSALEALLARVAHARFAVSFDAEAPDRDGEVQRSLSVHFGIRPPMKQ